MDKLKNAISATVSAVLTRLVPGLKTVIRTAAIQAVLQVERDFGTGDGALKKQAAIDSVVNALKLPPILRPIARAALVSLIENAVAGAVRRMR